MLNKMSGDLGAGSGSFPEITRDSTVCFFNSLVSKELSDVSNTMTRTRAMIQGTVGFVSSKPGLFAVPWDTHKGGVLTSA